MSEKPRVVETFKNYQLITDGEKYAITKRVGWVFKKTKYNSFGHVGHDIWFDYPSNDDFWVPFYEAAIRFMRHKIANGFLQELGEGEG